MNQTQSLSLEPLDFIAFKIPARMKRQLRVLAQQQGSNLSELVRSQCMVLLNERASGCRLAASGSIHFPGDIGHGAGV
jgi:hypothetical protein